MFFRFRKGGRLLLDREKYPMTFPMALRLNGVIAQEVAVRESVGARLPAVRAKREARNGASMVQKAGSRGRYGVVAGAPPAGASEERRPKPRPQTTCLCHLAHSALGAPPNPRRFSGHAARPRVRRQDAQGGGLHPT